MKDLGIESHKGTYYQKSNKDLFDQLKKENKHSKYLPKIHIFPEAGLMNDPNGLAYFNDQYHVFFQWYPFGTVHGLKHWGHTTSTDLVHWSSQEFALIPNQEYEKTVVIQEMQLNLKENFIFFIQRIIKQLKEKFLSKR